MREHAWRYFELHANQRMATFNFFLVASGAIAAGLATTLQGTQRVSSLGVALGILLMLVAFISWKLDQRVAFLVKHAERALSETEQAFPADAAACLFKYEPHVTAQARNRSSFLTKHWTYGRSFRFVFWVVGLFGLGGAVLSCLKFAGVISW